MSFSTEVESIISTQRFSNFLFNAHAVHILCIITDGYDLYVAMYNNRIVESSVYEFNFVCFIV